ncbi:hypothetical protein H5T55_03010 [Candidatus Bipolaricaulota bacterium]|nr:hypothetical protein [Candidatus Bipolaricaulota bacterium]
MLAGYSRIGDPQVEVRHAPGERGYAEDTLSAIREALPSVLSYFSYFGVEQGFPRIGAVLAPCRAEFDRLVHDLLRVNIERPSHPARIAQAQRMDMVVLSPSAYATESTFPFVPAHFRRLLHHELVHIGEEFLSPNIEAVPLWWSEGLAVHLSRQWAHEPAFARAAQTGIAAELLPSLSEIERSRRHANDWGWTWVWFVERTYGTATVREIVATCVNGDVLSLLPCARDALQRAWRQAVSTDLRDELAGQTGS